MRVCRGIVDGIEALHSDPGEDRWRGPYIKKMAVDPWGNAFVYRSPAEESDGQYEIICLGADGEFGGENVRNPMEIG